MAWLIDRFRYAFAGIRYGWLHDKSIRWQLIAAAAAVLAGFLFQIRIDQWLWVALAVALVIMAEIFNSCIEKTIDYISLERNEKARVIKDMAASAVFVVSCFAFLVGVVVFLPPLIQWIQRIAKWI